MFQNYVEITLRFWAKNMPRQIYYVDMRIFKKFSPADLWPNTKKIVKVIKNCYDAAPNNSLADGSISSCSVKYENYILLTLRPLVVNL